VSASPPPAANKTALLALLGGTWPDVPPSAAEWTQVAAMAADQRLEPLLAWHAERGAWPLPATIAATWHKARRDAAMTALAQQSALRLALARLGEAGIAAVALKGVALAWRHYPEAALRPMRDLDLLVAEDRAIEASQVLAAAGFVPETTDAATLRQALADDHQLPGQYHPGLGVTIELHHRLGDPPQRRGYRMPQLDPAGVMARATAVECGGATILCPAPQDLAAHMIVHALYGHRLDCGPLVLADLHFLAAGGTVDWAALRDEAERGGWARGLDLLLALVERSFGTLPAPLSQRPPHDVLAAAEAALLLDPAARGQAEALSELTAAQSRGAWGRALLRRLAPDPQVVAQEGGGRSALAFWPIWATRRISRAIGRRGHGADARAAADVMRWIQL
jgi:Uncharacterised nucleotidyltransferase